VWEWPDAFRGMSSKVGELVFGRQNGKQVDRWKEACVAEGLCSVNRAARS
jgi:hypothetical protein